MTKTKKKGQAEAEMSLTTGIISSITDFKKPHKIGVRGFVNIKTISPIKENTLFSCTLYSLHFSLAPCTAYTFL